MKRLKLHLTMDDSVNWIFLLEKKVEGGWVTKFASLSEDECSSKAHHLWGWNTECRVRAIRAYDHDGFVTAEQKPNPVDARRRTNLFHEAAEAHRLEQEPLR